MPESSDDDAGSSGDEAARPVKKRYQSMAPNYSDDEEEFQNPLQAAKESGFEAAGNCWLKGEYSCVYVIAL